MMESQRTSCLRAWTKFESQREKAADLETLLLDEFVDLCLFKIVGRADSRALLFLRFTGLV